MWFTAGAGEQWAPAVAHLSRDKPLAEVIRRIGPCTLVPRRDHFIKLCQSIFSQQVSVKAAAAMFHRFRGQFPRRCPTPQRVSAFLTDGDPKLIRQCGLSRQKRVYLLDLSRHFEHGLLPTRRLATMDDDAVIDALVAVNGIGRWTAEMFLIFCLNRPDVWPIDDIGLQEGVRLAYGHPARMTKAELTTFGERFGPWRSIATWYFWRGKGD